MTTPYAALSDHSFWRRGVAEAHWEALEGLYAPRFPITPQCRVATAGSCFAQHIGSRLHANGYQVLDVEPPPPGLTGRQAQIYGFNLYSARYGNIYTARHLRQLVEQAVGEREPLILPWAMGDRFVDGLRPALEPSGLKDQDEVAAHRRQHLDRVLEMILGMDVLVFTLGLTEAWIDLPTGAALPVCPGLIAGAFDSQRHAFHNFSHAEVVGDLRATADLVEQRRRQAGIETPVRILLTVSPVPLTATATGSHVLTATQYSKAVLRAAAGEFCSENPRADYFPSYEIIASAWAPDFYDANRRTVTSAGVDVVMGCFFRAHGAFAISEPDSAAVDDQDGDVFCEEAMLDALDL